MQLGVFGALQVVAGNALLHQLQAARVIAVEDEVHAEVDERGAVLGCLRLRERPGLRLLVFVDALGHQVAQPLVALCLLARAEHAGGEALVDHLLRLAR